MKKGFVAWFVYRTAITCINSTPRIPYVHLTADERETIAQLHHDGQSQSSIVRILQRSPSTISSELNRNRDFKNRCSAIRANRKAHRQIQVVCPSR